MLLIGSYALKLLDEFEPDTILTRVPRDYDFIATYEEVESIVAQDPGGQRIKAVYPENGGRSMVLMLHFGHGTIVPLEFEIAWPGTTAAELLEDGWIHRTSIPEISEIGIRLPTCFLPNLNILYTLKMSHRFLKDSPHFEKTRQDILAMRKHGAWVPEHNKEWFKRREKETYHYAHPSLAQSKNRFFAGDGVRYVYDHDSLHEAVKHHTQPIYKMFQKDGAEVAVDRDKWEALPRDFKLDSVLEESYVLALERSQIPFPGKKTPEESFKIALRKVCTSITSGWWREFAWENYDEVLDRYRTYDYPGWYMTAFAFGLRDGVVKKLQQPELEYI